MSQTKLKVQLLAYTPEPEKVITAAAKLCYSSSKINELLNDLTSEKIKSFIKMLESIGHQSPFEHVSFTFGIEGVSRSLTHQLVRHRLASYSQKSQRYVTEGQFEYVIPPEIEKIPEAKELFIKAMEQDQYNYNELLFTLENKYTIDYFEEIDDTNFYKMVNCVPFEFLKGLKQHKDKANEIEKRAAEDARFVLPNAAETKIIVTMNARELLHFFNHRTCNRAQWEIRAMAIEMIKLVKQVTTNIFKNAGPNCLKGPCPEGKFSCQRITEVRDFFKSI